MHQCKGCGLAFEQVNAQGMCDSCAARAIPQQTNELDELKRSIQQQGAQLQQVMGALQQPRQQAAPPQQPDRADFARRALTDPQAVFQEQEQRTLQQAAQIAQNMVGSAFAQDHETMTSVARSQARELIDPDMREHFDRYRSEIEREMTQVQPQFQRNVQVWKAAGERVIGAHMREIMHSLREKENAGKAQAPAVRVVRNDGPAMPSTRPAGTAPAEDVDAFRESRGFDVGDWRKATNRLRMSDADLMRGVKAFENQGDAEDPTKPSSWDPYMSFDDSTGKLGRTKAAKRKAREAVTA